MPEPNPQPEPPLVLRVEAPPTPPSLPRPGLGEAVVWCLVFLATQIVGALLTAGLVLILLLHDAPGDALGQQLAGLGKATAPNQPADQRPPIPAEIASALAWAMLGAQVASLGLILLVVPRRVGPDWKRQLGLRRPAGLHVFLALVLLPGFMILSSGIQELLVKLTGIKSPFATDALNGVFAPWPLWLSVATVGLGPGIVEEFWCRGFLGRGLCARHGLVLGVVVTSLLFGFLHIDPLYAVVTACMGAFLHFVYLASRSIWVPVLLHALNNGIAILAVLTGVAVQLQADPQGLTPVIYLASFSLVLFAGIALWTSRARLVPNMTKEVTWKPEYPGISAPPPGSDAGIGYEPPSPVAAVFALVSLAVLVYLLSR